MNWDDVRVFLAVAQRQNLARGARDASLDRSTASRRIAALEKSRKGLKTKPEKQAAEDVLALVRHDKILDETEVAPARAALARLLGIEPTPLPAAPEKVLTHAGPIAA